MLFNIHHSIKPFLEEHSLWIYTLISKQAGAKLRYLHPQVFVIHSDSCRCLATGCGEDTLEFLSINPKGLPVAYPWPQNILVIAAPTLYSVIVEEIWILIASLVFSSVQICNKLYELRFSSDFGDSDESVTCAQSLLSELMHTCNQCCLWRTENTKGQYVEVKITSCGLRSSYHMCRTWVFIMSKKCVREFVIMSVLYSFCSQQDTG